MIYITIGGLTTSFIMKNKKLANAISARYKGYIDNSKKRSLTVQCTFSFKKFSPFQRVRLQNTVNYSWHAVRYDFDCKWDAAGGSARLWPSLYSFDALLRVFYATQLIVQNGLLLHACAVVRNNAAFVFAGPSGSGKTTIARLSTSQIILNDEIITITIDKTGKVYVTGTPFWGEMGSGPAQAKSYRLQALYFLHKSSSTRSQPVGLNKAVGKLLRCLCIFGNSPQEINQSLEICSRIIKRVRFADLFFEKKALDWSKI
jgi:hypothetical protein